MVQWRTTIKAVTGLQWGNHRTQRKPMQDLGSNQVPGAVQWQCYPPCHCIILYVVHHWWRRSGQVSGYFRPNLVASVRRFSQKMSQSCTQIDTEIVKETRTFCNDYISLWILTKNWIEEGSPRSQTQEYNAKISNLVKHHRKRVSDVRARVTKYQW